MTRLLTLLLLCLAIGTGRFLLTGHSVFESELADYLPEDTLVLVEWQHGSQLGEQWQLDQLRKAIGPAAWRQLLQASQGETLATRVCQLVSTAEEFANRPAVSSLLKNGVAFALLPEGGGGSDFALSRQWLVAVRVDDGVPEQQFEELFGHIQSRQSVDHQGEALLHLMVDDGQDFFYWRHRNVALVACEQALIRQSIDQNLQRMIRKANTLSMNSAYLRLRRLVQDGADIFCYVDLAGLSRQEPLVQEIETTSGGLLPRCIALGYYAAAGTGRLTINALVDQESASAFISRHRLPAPVRQPLAEPMPQETVFALWTNWFKPKYLWDVARRQASDDVASLMSSIAQQLSAATGKSLDDFFDVFGEEFGVMVTEQSMSPQSSRFLGGLFVALHDRPAVEAMIEQMMDGLQVITVKSGDLEISSVMLAGGLLQSAYILLQQHLILADSVELVEAVRRQLLHDGTGGGQAGVADRADRQGNVAVFFRVGEVAERLASLLSMLVKATDERNQILSREARDFVREIGLPLLTALRNVSIGRFRGYLADGAIFMELEYTLSATQQ
ncbi:MAG: hypothetical protein FWD79_09905 [Desulfobulbus sp.]|nr:hypothetical protein [Desulfobulbus sp.]